MNFDNKNAIKRVTPCKFLCQIIFCNVEFAQNCRKFEFSGEKSSFMVKNRVSPFSGKTSFPQNAPKKAWKTWLMFTLSIWREATLPTVNSTAKCANTTYFCGVGKVTFSWCCFSVCLLVFFSFDAHSDSWANQTHQENHGSQFHIECFFGVFVSFQKGFVSYWVFGNNWCHSIPPCLWSKVNYKCLWHAKRLLKMICNESIFKETPFIN